MASIRKRGSGYEVRIRRKGYKTVARHFRTKAEAEKAGFATCYRKDH
jgi:hypothetical protein